MSDPHAHRRGVAGPDEHALGHKAGVPHAARSPNGLAFSATAHCLTGCAIGEVLGMVIGTALEWPESQTIALAVVLAFFFGYALTMVPLLRSGLARGGAPARVRSRHRLARDHGGGRQRDHAPHPGRDGRGSHEPS